MDPVPIEVNSAVFRRNFKRRDDSARTMVPARLVGKVIGRGGSVINELQNQSGARIIVTKERLDGDMVVVKLIGGEEATERARQLIDEITNEAPMERTHVAPRTALDEPVCLENIDWCALSKESDRQMEEHWSKLPPMRKEFYVEHPEVAAMPADEVRLFRERNNNIVVSRVFGERQGARPVPNPTPTFAHCFGAHPEIMAEIERMGFERPSPIQAQGWPVLLSGDDLIGIAQTGTGKTLAFLLPALIHIEGQPVPRAERAGPNVLIMAPTRELALQIDREVNKYHYRGIKSVCLYGGGSRKEQINVVTRGVEIIIATPGRLNDLVQAGYVDVATVTYLVLDEADRMLDMGFEPQIRKVLLNVRPGRQTVMTSATWPAGVRRLAQSYMRDPVQVYVGSLDLAAVHSVTQVVQLLADDEDHKFRTFLDWVRCMQPDDKAIVFCGKKARADHLASELVLLGVDCQSIHGDRDQCDREQALVDIADGSVQILIATDVASRGIDIKDITHVINYDFPRNVEEYVHRVGRTGRAGRAGQSVSYFTRADWANAQELINILQEADQFVPDELLAMAARYKSWRARRDQDGRSGDRRGGAAGGGHPRYPRY